MEQSTAQQMETFDFSNTPDDLLLPDMFYNWEITGMETRESGSNKTLCSVCGTDRGKKMINVEFTVLEPADFAGARVNENYVIGTENDPCVHRQETLAARVFGAVYFKQLLKAVQVPLNQMSQLKGKRCQRATIQVTIEGKNGKQVLNNFAKGASGMLGVYPVGTVAVGQPTPDNAYPKGGTRQSPNRPNGGASNPVPASNVSCPRCGKEFPGNAIDDHMADCLGS